MKKNKKRSFNKRLKISLVLLTTVFLLLIGQLTRIMVIQSQFLSTKAESQSTSQQKVMPKRGVVYDRNGRELAVSADVYRVSLDIKALDDYCEKYNKSKTDIASKISEILQIEPKTMNEIVERKDSKGDYLRGISIARKVEKPKIDKLKELRTKEKYNFMIIDNDPLRYYPNNNFLAHVLGTVNIDGEGLFGVEKYYDKELAGIPGIRISEVDRNSIDLPYDEAVYTEPVNGKNLILTIDENIQYIAEKVAQKALEDNKAKGVSIVVTNPKNGEILAMVNKPDFNPNDPRKGITNNDELQQLWRNKAVNDIYEPGSTFKIITTVAALSEQLTHENDQFYCKGYTIVNGVRINCWKPEGHGAENLVDILKNSCNPGFIELSKRLGAEKLNKYIYDFGFGKPVGIDLPGEAAGIIKPADKVSPLDLATIAFGQSDAATVVQLLAAFNAVMNNGIYTTPHIMKEISSVDKEGNAQGVSKYEEKNSRQVIDKSIANQVAAYLEKVVATSYKDTAYIKDFGIAGKTGTAEKANSGGKGYSAGKFISSFVGAAPYNDPQISLIVAIDEPQGEHFGGVIATPVAKELFQQIFNKMAIKPFVN